MLNLPLGVPPPTPPPFYFHAVSELRYISRNYTIAFHFHPSEVEQWNAAFGYVAALLTAREYPANIYLINATRPRWDSIRPMENCVRDGHNNN